MDRELMNGDWLLEERWNKQGEGLERTTYLYVCTLY